MTKDKRPTTKDESQIEHFVGGLPSGAFGTHDAELGFGQTIADLDGHGTLPLSLGFRDWSDANLAHVPAA